jgi:excisionase family DNA binding protein
MIRRKLLSAKYVATLLGVTTQHIRNLVKRGDITTVKVGARYMFKHEDIDRFINENTYNQIKGAY